MAGQTPTVETHDMTPDQLQHTTDPTGKGRPKLEHAYEPETNQTTSGESGSR